MVPPSFLPAPRDPLTLAAGSQLTCAITADGRVRCWGNQAFTVLADGGPLDGVTGLAVGRGFGCAANRPGGPLLGQERPGPAGPPARAGREQPGAAGDRRARRAFWGPGSRSSATTASIGLCAWGHNGTHLVTDSDAINIYRGPVCSPVPDVVELAVGADHACVRHAAGHLLLLGRALLRAARPGRRTERHRGRAALRCASPPWPRRRRRPGGRREPHLRAAGRRRGHLLRPQPPGAGRPRSRHRPRRRCAPPRRSAAFPARWSGWPRAPTAQHTCAILQDGSVAVLGRQRRAASSATSRPARRRAGSPPPRRGRAGERFTLLNRRPRGALTRGAHPLEVRAMKPAFTRRDDTWSDVFF